MIRFRHSFLLSLIIVVLSLGASAQTTEFSHQGSLNISGSAANGNYDFEFRLFDTSSGPTQIGSTVQRLNVAVTNGIYSVSLDFAAISFPGADRYLDISVRPAGAGAFTPLAPRQKITSTPHAIRSRNATAADSATNATQLGGVAAGQYVQTTDARMSDARNPIAGSSNYIQNGAAQQSSSSFNISGNGVAGGVLSAGTTVNAGIGFTISGTPVFRSPSGTSLFVGKFAGSGPSNTGDANAFVGSFSGGANTTGHSNSFFGTSSGVANTVGMQNAFFGANAGDSNASGHRNSMFGFEAGSSVFGESDGAYFGYRAGALDTASGNSSFGSRAGEGNTTGFNNSFFGNMAGAVNETATNNAFFGHRSGMSNKANQNAFFGSLAGETNSAGQNNSFFGYNAGTDNTIGSGNTAIGASAGLNNFTGSLNTFVGAQTGQNTTTGNGNTFIGVLAGNDNLSGSNNTIIGNDADVGANNLTFATAIGSGAIATQSNNVVLGRPADIVRVPGSFASVGVLATNSNLAVVGNGVIAGTLSVATLGAAGATDVCRNASNELSTCSSSMRYKSRVAEFTAGLEIVKRLRPISFDWIAGKVRDIGFGAEQVASVEPLLATYNDRGEIEGVKYKQLTTVLVNAVNEQQTQIERLTKQVELLTKVICRSDPLAEVCTQNR